MSGSAANAAVQAADVLDRLAGRNARVPEERAINLRVAAHFGEVDVIDNDREGPHVSSAFRLEAVSPAALAGAIDAIPPDQFPLRNYVLVSEEFAEIITARSDGFAARSVGLFKLKGFPGRREVFLLDRRPPPVSG